MVFFQRFRLQLILAALAAVYGLWMLLSHSSAETPEHMLEIALHGASPDEQDQAANRLAAWASKQPLRAERNAGRPYLAKMFDAAPTPGVKCAAMRGLAAIWDYEYVPQMLALIDDPSPAVRQTAVRSMTTLMSLTYAYDPSGPPDKRAAAAKEIRKQWDIFKSRDLNNWQKRMAAEDAKAPAAKL